MNIICKWVFRTGIDLREWKAKQRQINDMSSDEVMEMITSLLAQNETVRLIFEIEERK